MRRVIVLFILSCTLFGCDEGLKYLKVLTDKEVPEAVIITTELYEDVSTLVDYLVHSFNHENDDKLYGPARVLRENEDETQRVMVGCAEGVFVIAGFMEQFDIPPIALYMGNRWSGLGHAIFLYKIFGKFGSIGLGRFDWQLPIYNTSEKLVRAVADQGGFYADSYDIFNIRVNYPNYDVSEDPLPPKAGRFQHKLNPPEVPDGQDSDEEVDEQHVRPPYKKHL